MPVPQPPDTTDLLALVSQGDEEARAQLLGRYRGRLCRMVLVRMDRRLLSRFDPSDVVPEALTTLDHGRAWQSPDDSRSHPRLRGWI